MDKPCYRKPTHPGWTGACLGIILAGLLLAGCAVGPDFRRPDAPETKSYTAGPLAERTAAAPVAGGESQRFVTGKAIAQAWWEVFQCPELSALIRQALERNPSVAAAQAALRQAQENRRAALGVLSPQVDANASATRQKVNGASSGQSGVTFSPYNLYNASVAVSYTLDIFGAARRELEALESQVDYQRFELEATYLALSANIVTTVVQEVSIREQIRVNREIVALLQHQLDMFEKQYELGALSMAEVLAQKTQLAQAQALLPPMEKALDQNRHQLAILTGCLPSEARLPEFTLATLSLPRELPVSLPSDLVRQRPDIQAAEALLHAACAQVGVATANLYPRVTLSAGYGSQATDIGELFSGPAGVWNFGGQMLQPILHGGTLRAQRRAAIAAYDRAQALYRATVLQAFGNVADSLKALEADARTLEAQASAAEAARQTLELVDQQYKAGAVNYLSLLAAQREYLQTSMALTQVQTQRYADTAALFQSLGGGWWNRDHTADKIAEHAKE